MSNPQIVSLLVALMPLIISLAGALYKALLEKLPSEQRTILDQVASTAVNAVEQQFSGADSTEKKAQAVAMAMAALKNFGVKADPTVISMLIEEAVFSLNQSSASSEGAQPGGPVGFTSPTQVAGY